MSFASFVGKFCFDTFLKNRRISLVGAYKVTGSVESRDEQDAWVKPRGLACRDRLTKTCRGFNTIKPNSAPGTVTLAAELMGPQMLDGDTCFDHRGHKGAHVDGGR